MSIGRALDRLIDTALIAVGDLANRFFDTYWPMEVSERANLAVLAFTKNEEVVEVWEPGDLDDTLFECSSPTCGCHDDGEATLWSDNPIYRELQENWGDEEIKWSLKKGKNW